MIKPIERKFAPISSLSNIKLENRADNDSNSLPQISGYSAIFDSETIINGWFDSWRETIRSGFFAPAIRDKHDVRALFNHDANYVLGRTSSPKKTLQIKEDKTGLFSIITPPNTTVGRDTVESIDRGDISGQSFAFTIAQEKWTKGNRAKGELDLRELTLIEVLYDVGPVTYPAFEDTDVEVDRSLGFPLVATRARGLAQFGEKLPGAVLREIKSRTQVQVPATFNLDSGDFDMTPEIRSLIKEVVKETLSEQLDEQSTTEPVDPPKKTDKIDIFETDPEALHETEAPAEVPVKEEPAVEEEKPEPEVHTEGDLRSEFLRLEKVALGQ